MAWQVAVVNTGTEKKETNAIDAKLFSEPFTQNNTGYQVYETSKIYKNTEGKSIKLHRLVIWNKKAGSWPVAV